MTDIKDLLTKRQKKLLKVQKKKEKELLKAPEGSLRLCDSGNRTQYYHRQNTKDKAGTFIREENHALARKLAQKDYNKKIVKAAEAELKAIQQFLHYYPETNIEEVYENLHKKRQCLIAPLEETDEIFIKNWEEVTYQGNEFYRNDVEIYTYKGERVRSKSECIIANLLYQEGIPYRYEQPLYLHGLGWVYPDFTILNVRLRKEFYLEHMGLMDDPEYMEKALNKINVYIENGIFPGDQLLLTHETGMHPLNPRQVMRIIDHYLK